MTLTTQTQRWEYVGDGATTIFAYDARVDIASDMKAFLNGLPTDISFTVTGLGNDNGGDVIFNSPPALDVAISLERILPFQQTTDFPVRGPFPAEANEGTFDRIVMMLQQTRTNLIDIQAYLGIGVGGGGEIFPIGGQVPPGLIAEWAGAVTDIPNGWFLCDGTNNTPDLKGRFIASLDEGAAPGEFGSIGEIGGENDVTLTLNEMPNHKHDVSPIGVDGLFTPPPGSSTTSGGSESRADVLVDGVTGHTQADGVALPHNNVPLYYTLAYIQYQGGSLPPSFTGSFPSQEYREGDTIIPIDMSTEFSVGDGTNPVYSAFGLPPGISIDPVSGVITGTIAAGAQTGSPYSAAVTLTTSINPPATSFPASIWSIVDFVNSFPAVSNYDIWLNPDTIVASAGNVTGWLNDGTANATDADLVQVGAAMPEAQINGANVCLSADATSRYLDADTPNVIPDGFTIFMVGAFTTTVSASALLDAPSGARALVLQTGIDITIQGDATVTIFTDFPNDVLPHVFACRFEANQQRARISGDVDGWVDNPDVTGQSWNYGKLLQSQPGVQAIGWVGELIVYKSALSDLQMSSVYDALVAKWGL